MELPSDLKNLLIVGTIVVVVLILGIGHLMSEVQHDKELRNVAFVVVGFTALVAVLRTGYPLLIIIPLGVVWLFFRWWWTPFFFGALLAMALVNSRDLGKWRFFPALVLTLFSAYPLAAELVRPWKGVLVILSGQFVGAFLGRSPRSAREAGKGHGSNPDRFREDPPPE